ncbi:MAG TPA: alpha/beta hydrolase [Propionibacteriaceae bacterium]
MPVRTALRPMLALSNRFERPTPPGLSIQARRQADARGPLQMRIVTARGRIRVLTRDHHVPVDGGTIVVRSYRTADATRTRPAHVYLHGGSFWLGSVADYDPICRWYAGATDAVIVSVDYRLAPEHPFPTGLEDAYAALVWVVEHAVELGIDPARVSVGGFSAGGALAAAVAILARDRGGPAVVLQALESPILDLTLGEPSVTEFGIGYGLTRASLVEAYGFYLPEPDQSRDPYASPLLAPDVSGLPPAFVLTCECDPLRDEGEAYAHRLSGAGVTTQLYRAPGLVHGSIYLTRFLPAARRAVAQTVAALRAAYA